MVNIHTDMYLCVSKYHASFRSHLNGNTYFKHTVLLATIFFRSELIELKEKPNALLEPFRQRRELKSRAKLLEIKINADKVKSRERAEAEGNFPLHFLDEEAGWSD